MTIQRRSFLQLAALGALAPRSFAPQGASEPRASKEPTLRLLVPEGSQANLDPVIEAFKKARGVDVELLRCGVDDVATEMTLRTLAGTPDFDMALPATFSLPDLAELKVIQPLDGLLDGLPGGQHAGARGADSKSLYSLGDRYKGETYGLQTDGDVYLMFYNHRMLTDRELRKRFEDAFQRELEVPKTWAELDRALEFFHRPDQNQYGGALFRSPSYMAWEFWIRLHAKGVFPVDDEVRPLIEGPEGVAAAEEMVRASEWLCPNAETAGLFENWETFSKGQTFCNIGWGGSQKYFRRQNSPIRESVEVGLTPGGIFDGKPTPLSYFNWGWNFTVSSTTQNAKLCAEFAAFATSGEAAVAAVRAQDGFFDPYLEAHYRDEQIIATYTEPFLERHRTAMETAIPDFYMAGRGEYFDLLGRFLARANSGKLKVHEALSIVAKGWELITERQGRASQIAQWQYLKGRYPETIRSELRSS